MDPLEVSGRLPLRLELAEMHHAGALERFERANREFFARRVSDRGDEYFDQFEQLLATLVDENHSARTLCFVLVDSGGEVVGRVNLYHIDRPEFTELGFGWHERPREGRGHPWGEGGPSGGRRAWGAVGHRTRIDDEHRLTARAGELRVLIHRADRTTCRFIEGLRRLPQEAPWIMTTMPAPRLRATPPAHTSHRAARR